MTTATTFLSVPKEEIELNIEALLKRSRMTWKELEEAAESFNLNDADLATYRTIRSLRWISLGQ